MSTRYFNNRDVGANIPDDFDIPSCTIEDVDRSLFTLFDKELPFTYEHKKATKRAPVIFASGERFAVLRRKQPLRDKAGALILPLVSIMRTGISQVPTMGAGTAQNVPMTIKKRLSKEDPFYQRLLNKEGLLNSDDHPSANSFENPELNPDQNSAPGKNASRRDSAKRSKAEFLSPNLRKNIYEVIQIPPPKYFTATYEVTFWAQYTLQMNDMMTAMMSLYQSFSQRTFQLETPKGYWFVGYMGEEITPGSNFDDFTDNERLVRCSFTVTVPAYIVNPVFPGSQKTLRRYVSAPEISFEGIIAERQFERDTTVGQISGDPGDHVLEDLRKITDPIPGQSIGATKFVSSDSRSIIKREQGSQQEKIEESKDKPTPEPDGEANVGGAQSDDDATKIVKVEKDPFTGEENITSLHLKTRVNRQGESVLREVLGDS